VSSQKDAEKADLAKEREEHLKGPLVNIIFLKLLFYFLFYLIFCF